MVFDRHGIGITSSSIAAVAHLDRAVLSFLAHRTDMADHLDAALADDADLVVGQCLAGFAHLLHGRAEVAAPAARVLGLAQDALGRRGGTERERGLTQALRLWCGGDMTGSADRLEELLGAEPLDLLTGKLLHMMLFMLGDAAAMRRATERVLPAWTASMADYGFVLGWHAFALGETGELAAAERAGRRAVENEPDDVWGCHAVIHVHEMRGEPENGLAWLVRHEGRWGQVNNFVRHLAWHEALFQLSRGDTSRVLEVYDRAVRDVATDDYRDVANAASLLRRLERRGVQVGRRWAELADLAERRSTDHALAFAQLHYLFCLVGDGRLAAAAHQVAAMARSARAGDATQARVLQAVGVPLARSILAEAAGGDAGPVGLTRDDVARLGGSRVQRRIFDCLLADAEPCRPARVA